MATKISTLPFDTLSIEKRSLLTFGYVNDMEKNNELSNTIPPEINEMICSYNRCSDTWDNKYLNKNTIELTGNRIKSLKHDYTTTSMYGNVSLSSGIHTWKLRLVKRPKNSSNQQPFVGFIKDDPDILEKFKSSHDWYLDDNGYIYCCGCGTVGYNSTFDSRHKTPRTCREDGDVLYITLDLDEHKIYLSINGEEAFVPTSFTNIRKGKYRLVVSIYRAKGTVIELL